MQLSSYLVGNLGKNLLTYSGAEFSIFVIYYVY